jgi:hypothetical protein
MSARNDAWMRTGQATQKTADFGAPARLDGALSSAGYILDALF